MAQRLGKYTLRLPSRPVILGYAAVGGKKEGEGPLGTKFDYVYEDSAAGEKTWEKAESTIHGDAVRRAISKAGLTDKQVNIIFAGDLLNQCIGTTFGIRETGIPFAGVYGACSTMALSMAMASVSVDSAVADIAVASTSSHFCSAEKQFRMPLEYGGQRTPTAQWTATAAGATVVGKGRPISESAAGSVVADKIIIGRICDYGIKDANNMGAAMAPAACATISDFLRDTNTVPEDYDMILTGDLGAVGTTLLRELMIKQENIDISNVHADCGLILFDVSKQKDVGAGGSGCGCSGAVLCSEILPKMESGEIKKVLFVGTGALMSSVSSLQNESIPAVAHGILLKGGDVE